MTDAIRVNDPSALRALAHPLRLKIIGELRTRGAMTVGQLAAALSAAPGSVSYHLATLATHGFVAPAPDLARDGRERWWRATADTTHYVPAELQEDPEQREASWAFRRTIVQSYEAELLEHLDREDGDAPEWIEAATLGDIISWLTADEADELRREVEELAARWSRRGYERRDDADVRPVRFIYASFGRR